MKTKQREWLVEDLAQIERLFPGATIIETIETPFDINIKTRPTSRRLPRAFKKPSKNPLKPPLVLNFNHQQGRL